MFEAFRTVLLDFPKRTVGAIARVTVGLVRLSLVIRKKKKKKKRKKQPTNTCTYNANYIWRFTW